VWIAAPDAPEASARARFGDAYVDSGSQCRHQELAEESFAGIFEDVGLSEWLIRHPRSYLTGTGFTDNRFAARPDRMSNVHASPEFYESALTQLLALLARQDSGYRGPNPAVSS